ncbi:thioredoxin family protein [uncultured Mesonia sp.]|uniref:thioredoxin family protein n=1 Tax=uncultured Mesonia sp. TaxID=399731 RepID=UPI00374F0BCD
MNNLVMNKVLILIFFLYGFKADDSNLKKGIDFFKGDIEEAIEVAKIEDKLIFVEFYASWCGVCKKLKKETFKDKEVGDFYNQHFVNLKYNAEKGEGRYLAQQFNVRAYPTLIYLNENGKILGKFTGFKAPYPFIQQAKIFTSAR